LKRFIEITFTNWNGINSPLDAPVIILKLSIKSSEDSEPKEIAKAMYYYPEDHKSKDFIDFMMSLTEIERKWVMRIIGNHIIELKNKEGF